MEKYCFICNKKATRMCTYDEVWLPFCAKHHEMRYYINKETYEKQIEKEKEKESS